MADAPTNTAAGTSGGEPGEPAAAPSPGVPIVDLTGLVENLRTEADRCRENAETAADLADGQRRQAGLLDALAGILSGAR